jgi:endo-1,4-beta-xylanase
MKNKVTWDLSLPSLKTAFEKYFQFGNILTTEELGCKETLDMYLHHYNSVTAENAMKPMHISKKTGEYNFEHADKLVEWAYENGIDIVGHTLVWHGQSSPWLNRNPDGTHLTRAEAKANLEAYIKNCVTHYSGRVYSWDVVNEPFRDDNEFSGNWRNHVRHETNNERAVGHWYLAYANGADEELGESGTDFVFDAFYFARRYDPNAVLYINDYNEETPTKREALAQMVEELNEEWSKHSNYDGRLLIEGIGMQMHCNEKTNLEDVRKSMERFSKTGALISITEMDITFGSPEDPAKPLSPEQSQRQVEMYAELFNLFIEFSEYIERVTIWGKNDSYSWRDWGSPTLFGAEGEAKDSFKAIVELANK